MGTVDGPTISGAHVYVDGNSATKYAPSLGPVADRIQLQATFLHAYERFDWLPRLHRRFGFGYQMERLHALPACIDDEALTRTIFTCLRDLWGIEPLPRCGRYTTPRAHSGYVLEKAERVGLRPVFHDWWEKVWPIVADTRTCRVHGDPTWDNCMVRLDGSLVITDPIPPGAALPSIRALDIGKVLQSVMGYEEVVKGRRPTMLELPSAVFEDLLPEVDSLEWEVALYFAAVHFLRLLPYTPEHTEEWKERIMTLHAWREP